MDPHINAMFSLKYTNPTINRLIPIYKRTRKCRIKNKLFKRLWAMCVDEKGVIVLDDIVVIRYDLYQMLCEADKSIGAVVEKTDDAMAVTLREG